MDKCESCGKEAKANVNVPLPFGIFKADMCLDCGLQVHENKDMLFKIIRERAKKLKISLPTSPENLKKILETKVSK